MARKAQHQRSCNEILGNLLQTAREQPANKYVLGVRARLATLTLYSYMDICMKAGLLAENNGVYSITEKGRAALLYIEKMNELLNENKPAELNAAVAPLENG